MRGKQNIVFVAWLFLFDISVLLISADQVSGLPVSSLPLWQQVFANYSTWSGQYSYNNTIYTCRIGVLHVDQFVLVSFVDRNTHVDLKGYSVSDTVIFNKTDVYQSSDRIQGNMTFQLSGILTYNSVTKYWMYTANVTLPREKPFSQFKLMTSTEKNEVTDQISKTTSIVLGVVFSLAALGVILMAGSMIWSYRKGLLRHIPMSYRTFKNPREERRASFDSREETVHI